MSNKYKKLARCGLHLPWSEIAIAKEGATEEAREIPAFCPESEFIIPAVGLTVINRRGTRQFDSLIICTVPMRLLFNPKMHYRGPMDPKACYLMLNYTM